MGGGLFALILYLIISNTLWLIFGARLLQFLPGVKINGMRGTFKIAVMLFMSLLGVCIWMIKYLGTIFRLPVSKTSPKVEIQIAIQRAARIFNKID